MVVLILFALLGQTARATDSTQANSWVNVEIPYFGEQSIEVRITAVTIGNNLRQGMGIYSISSQSSSPPTGGGLSVSSTVTIEIQRPITEAEYSADSNMTTFTYTFSSADPVIHIAPFGSFPNDGWKIGVTFYSAFGTAFDGRTRYCSIPSQYYVGKYATTYSHNDTLGYMYYNLDLEISHPKTFQTFVSWIYYPLLIPLTLLVIVFTIIIPFVYNVRKKGDFNKLSGTYVTVSSAVIVFIPIFYLSTQNLKTPFTLTFFDYWLAILSVWYISLLVPVVLIRHIYTNPQHLLIS